MPGSVEEIQCTACRNIISTSGTAQQNIHAHPVLKVIICKICYINISSINFSNELCLWCGSSGIIVRCIQCSCHFCKDCLENNFKENVFINIIKKKRWTCFRCLPSSISEHQILCDKVMTRFQDMNSSTSHKRKRSISNSSESVGKRAHRSQSSDDASYDGDIEEFSTITTAGIEERDEKKEILKKVVGQLQSLFLYVKEYVTEFDEKIKTQSLSQKVLQNAYTYAYELLEKVKDTLSTQQNELLAVSNQWENDYRVQLIQSNLIKTEVNGTSINNNMLDNKVPSTSSKNKKHCLSLKRTYNTELTDDELSNETQENNSEKPQAAGLTEADISAEYQKHNNNVDSDHDILSQSTVVIDKNALFQQTDSSRSFLCEVTGNFIAEANTPNSTDFNLVSVSENYGEIGGSNSEKSFVFNLDGCVSAPANNESEDSDKTEICEYDHAELVIPEEQEPDYSAEINSVQTKNEKVSNLPDMQEKNLNLDAEDVSQDSISQNDQIDDVPLDQITQNNNDTKNCDNVGEDQSSNHENDNAVIEKNDCINDSQNQNIDDMNDTTMLETSDCIDTLPDTNNKHDTPLETTETTNCLNNDYKNIELKTSNYDNTQKQIINDEDDDTTLDMNDFIDNIQNQTTLDKENDAAAKEEVTVIVLDDNTSDSTEDNESAKRKYFESLGLTMLDRKDVQLKNEIKQEVNNKINEKVKDELTSMDVDDEDIESSKMIDAACKFLREDDFHSFSSDSSSNSTSDSNCNDDSVDSDLSFILTRKTKSKPTVAQDGNSDTDDEDCIINIDSVGNKEDNLTDQVKPCSVVLEDINRDNRIKPTFNNSNASDNELRNIERLTNLDGLEQNRKSTETSSNNKSRKHRITNTSSTVVSEEDADSESENLNELNLEDHLKMLKDTVSSSGPKMDDNLIKDIFEVVFSNNDFISTSESEDSGSSEEEKLKKNKKHAGSTDSDKENQLETSNIISKELTAEEKQKLEKKKWKNDYLLHQRFSESESGDESDGKIEGDSILPEKIKKKLEELEKKREKRYPETSSPTLEGNTDSNTKSETEAEEMEKDHIIINTDSDSDIEFISESKKKRTYTKSNNSEKISAICISSEEESIPDTDDETEPTVKGKGRKNIRAILSDETLQESTKKANFMEDKRKDRLSQKQKDMDDFFTQSQISQDEMFVLDIDKHTGKPLIVVDPILTERLKKHQKEGVRFMWQSCYESVEQLEKDPGSGCILAHCMGLGKTFQVVTLVHTLFSHPITKTKRVLIVCPLSIVLNWENEFSEGLKGLANENNIHMYCISERLSGVQSRLYLVDKWRRDGGILIMGYEAYQRLTKFKDPNNLTLQERNIRKILINPGPNLVVLDEGHLLKNGKNCRTKALMKVKTKRRIILTGTPLQNNLREYYYMVQFVKPNLLGSYREYTNRFVNPITNGQFHDSTEGDIYNMKRRIHVLHKLLEATIQRYEVSELCPYLPKKSDYVLFIQLHPVQEGIIEKLLELLKNGTEIVKGNIIVNYHKLHLLWTHPLLLHLKDEQKNNPQKKVKEMDVVNLEPELDEPDESPEGWWQSLCPNDFKTNIDYGPKFKVMLSIIRECEKRNDKVLVFSSSIIELDAIELFLQHHSTAESQWLPKQDYYRLDGTVPPEKRLHLCNSFNDERNKRARLFLISHRVGGLGLNLVASNRVIVMDVSWNPAYDLQSVFRIFRFGQKKPCYVYRLVAMGTMEEIVYQRTVNKLAIAGRVVDKMQMPRHYNSDDLQVMYKLNLKIGQERPLQDYHCGDAVLQQVLQDCKEVFKYHEHETLLLDNPAEHLNESERQKAWKEYTEQNEKEQAEALKKKSLAPLQPGSSGIQSFLPNRTTNISNNASINNQVAGICSRRTSFMQKGTGGLSDIFETVLLPNANNQDFTAEHVINFKANEIHQNNRIHELKEKYREYMLRNFFVSSPPSIQTNQPKETENNKIITPQIVNTFTHDMAVDLEKHVNSTFDGETENPIDQSLETGNENNYSFNMNEQQNIITCLNENLNDSLSRCDTTNTNNSLGIYETFATPVVAPQETVVAPQETVVSATPNMGNSITASNDVILIE